MMSSGRPRRLYRSRDDRILGGVAAGVGEYFDIDPTLVRLAWLLIVLWGGAGIILYLLAWILVPLNPAGNSHAAAAAEYDESNGASRGRATDRERDSVAWFLVVLGLAFVFIQTDFLKWLFFPGVMLAVLLIVIGLFVLGRNRRPPRVR